MLTLKKGQAVRNQDIDEQDLLFIVEGTLHYRWNVQGQVGGEFTDYLLKATPIGKDPIERRLRVLSDTEIAELRCIDRLPYTKEFEGYAADPTGIFFITDPDKVEYRRIRDVHHAFEAQVIDDNREFHRLRYWDFWRTKTLEGGVTRPEVLYIEMDAICGAFTLLLGDVLNPQQLHYL